MAPMFLLSSHSDSNKVTQKKVLFIMGATGTGKTKLSINLATRFSTEIINSDKIQVYKGLNIVTNKATESERQGVPHHLLGIIDDPDADFTVDDFCQYVLMALADISGRGHLAIIVGGSNTYLKALVEEPRHAFRAKYDCCFLWLDVALPVLFSYLGKRIDEMVQHGMVDEIREAYVAGADYSRGVRRAIGVPELDPYFQAENDSNVDEADKEELLKEGIRLMKHNTNVLASEQLKKIVHLKNKLGWEIHRVDSTSVFEMTSDKKAMDKVWEELVFQPCLKLVMEFVEQEEPPAAAAAAACQRPFQQERKFAAAFKSGGVRPKLAFEWKKVMHDHENEEAQ